MGDERVEEAGFEIEGRLYPMPQSFRLGDPVLVTQMTGLTWAQFVDALDDPDRQQDPVILLGLIAVAVWQVNQRWTRDRVARHVEQLDIGAVKVQAPEAEADSNPPPPPGDGDPPVEEPAASSATSPGTPNASPESPSEPTPPSSGRLGSDIGSPEYVPV